MRPWFNMRALVFLRRREMRMLDQFPRLPARVRRDQLATRLQDQLRYFAGRADALPAWREAARIDEPRALLAAWRELPILTKQDLKEHFEPNRIRDELGVAGSISSSGGSTGEPTQFLHDAATVRLKSATRWYTRLQHGWRPGMQIICVWGADEDIGGALSAATQRQDRQSNLVRVQGYHLTPAHTDAVVAALRRAPSVVYGFTSMLEYVARDVLRRGIEIPAGRVRGAWNGGEMLAEEQVELFGRAFGVPIHNMYGGRELGAMAYQPPGQASLRVLRPFRLVEVVDDQGRPVAPGEVGRLVWTDTVCRGTPFLRYDIGDLGAADPASVDESGIGALGALHGRSGGVVTLTNGATIQNLYWNHLFKEYPEVEQFQIAVRATGPLEVRLVGAGFTPERRADLDTRLTNFLPSTPFTVVWREHLALTARGKREQVVHEP